MPTGRQIVERLRRPLLSVDSPMTMEVGDNFRSIPVASSKERLEFFRRFLTKSGT